MSPTRPCRSPSRWPLARRRSALIAATLLWPLRRTVSRVPPAVAVAVVALTSLPAVPLTAVVAARLALLRRALAVVSRLRALLARRVAVELPHG